MTTTREASAIKEQVEQNRRKTMATFKGIRPGILDSLISNASMHWGYKIAVVWRQEQQKGWRQ